MSASLVGSEMCIRDRDAAYDNSIKESVVSIQGDGRVSFSVERGGTFRPCLLYTSDAADDM
eukprot:11028561-Alexandrium_andersonii.AAC.1